MCLFLSRDQHTSLHNLLSVAPLDNRATVPWNKLLLSWSPFHSRASVTLLLLRLPFKFGHFRLLLVPRLPHRQSRRGTPCRLSGPPAAPRNVPDKFHHLHTWAVDLDREKSSSLADRAAADLQLVVFAHPGISPEIRSAPILRRGPISLFFLSLTPPGRPRVPVLAVDTGVETNERISALNTTEATEAAGSSRPRIWGSPANLALPAWPVHRIRASIGCFLAWHHPSTPVTLCDKPSRLDSPLLWSPDPSLPLLPACHSRLHIVISRPTHSSPCLFAQLTRPSFHRHNPRLSTLAYRFVFIQGVSLYPRALDIDARVSLLQQRLQSIPPTVPASAHFIGFGAGPWHALDLYICPAGKHRDFLMFLMTTRTRVLVKTFAPRLASESRSLPSMQLCCP